MLPFHNIITLRTNMAAKHEGFMILSKKEFIKVNMTARHGILKGS